MSRSAGAGKTSRKKVFYVYALLDPSKIGKFRYGKWVFDFEPFYIGKGKGNRFTHHHSGETSNPFKARKIAKIERQGLKVEYCVKKYQLTERQALDFECTLIQRIGRRDHGLGPLTNLTDGGDGLINPSKATREKIGKASKGRKTFLGKKHTDETKAKIGRARLGKIHSEESKRMMSQKQQGSNNGFFGKEHSNETKEKLRAAKLGKVSPNKGVPMSEEQKQKLRLTNRKKCQAEGKVFPSLHEAAEALGIHPDTLRRRISRGTEGYGHL